MDVFPLPDTEQPKRQLNDLLDAAGQAMYDVAGTLASAVDANVGVAEDSMSAVRGKLTRSLGATVGKATRALKPVQAALGDLYTAQLDTLVAGSGESLATAPQSPLTAGQTSLLTPLAPDLFQVAVCCTTGLPATPSNPQGILWVVWQYVNPPHGAVLIAYKSAPAPPNTDLSSCHSVPIPQPTFTDLQSAIAWGQSNYANLVSMACPGSATTPPPPAPPAPPPQSTTTYKVIYSCAPACPPGVACSQLMTFVDDGTPASQANWQQWQQWGYHDSGQYFASAADAQNYIQTNGPALLATTCPPAQAPPPAPPAPCPPAPPCPQPPPKPPAPACLGANIPNILDIGSVSFCLAKDDLKKSFVQLGTWILDLWNMAGADDLVTKPTDPSTFGDWATSPVSTLIHGLWDAIESWFSDKNANALNQITAVVKCWWAAIKASQGCGMTEVATLCLVRAVIELLQKLRLGWDLALWGTVDIELHIDPLVKVLDYLIADACPAEIPGASEAIDCWIKGTLSETQLACWMGMNGANVQVWAPVIDARRERLMVEEYIEYQLRYQVPLQDIQDGLRGYGFTFEDERKAKLELYFELPTIADHLHWLQRNVFNAQYVAEYGLLDNFNLFWARFGPDLTAQGMKIEYAQNHYAAHWIRPSPGEGGEMLQRLRPGRVDPSIQFTLHDYDMLLAEQDIAPFDRPRFRAIAYQQPALRFLRQLFDTFQIDTAELAQRFQDLGYSEKDAGLLAASEVINRAKRRAVAAKGITPAVAAKLYVSGDYTKDQVFDWLSQQGYTRVETDDLCDTAHQIYLQNIVIKHKQEALNAYAKRALQAYLVGTATAQAATVALQRAGYEPDAADAMLQMQDISAAIGIGKQAIASVRKAFLAGEFDAVQSLSSLVATGIAQDRASQYVSSWQLLMTVPRIAVTTSKILDWFKRGLIDQLNASIRLANLGWSNVDAALQLAAAAQDVAKIQAKAAALAQSQAEKRSAKLAALAKAAQAQTKSIQQKLRQNSPVSKLVKWYASGYIDDTYFTDRLDAEGYDAPSIADYLQEAKDARTAYDAKKKKVKP